MRRVFVCVLATGAVLGTVWPAVAAHARSSDLIYPRAVSQSPSLPLCLVGGRIDVTVAASPLTLRNCQISGNRTAGNGGGLYVDGGATLTLIGVSITGNSAGGAGGGVFNNGTLNLTNVTAANNQTPGGAGGGIFNNGTLTVNGSAFTGNSAGYGGGIFNNQGGVLTVSGSTFGGSGSGQGNTAGVSGGGIYNANGTVSLSGTTFTNNGASYSGGGLELYGGQVSLHGVTFTGNHATVDAGAIQVGLGTLCNCGGGDPTVKITGNSAGTAGGGIENHSGQVTLSNATISGNTASVSGGGIHNKGGTFSFTNSTFSNNGPQNCGQESGTISDGGANTDSDHSCGFTASPPAAGTPIAADTFAGRTVSGGWGTASSGAQWVLRSGSATALSVAGNGGHIRGTRSSAYQILTLGTATASNEEVAARYSSGAFNHDVGRLLLRFADTQTYYAAGIGSPSGSAVLQITKTTGGVTSQLCSVPFAATNGGSYWERVRVQTSGSSAVISARAWASGSAEPSSWGVSCTDGAPLGAGLTGVDGWDGGVNWSIDSFSAVDLSAGAHLRTATASTRTVSACGLLTTAAVRSVYGRSARPLRHRTVVPFGACAYATRAGVLTFLAATTASLSKAGVPGGADAAHLYAQTLSTIPGKRRAITRLGDRAVWAPGVHQLWVLKGSLLFSLSNFAPGKGTLMHLERLARKVLARPSA